MDDAPRFDVDNGTSTVPNRDENGVLIGHSLNQESVDLNAHLCADKCYLARIARELGARLVINADRLLTDDRGELQPEYGRGDELH